MMWGVEGQEGEGTGIGLHTNKIVLKNKIKK